MTTLISKSGGPLKGMLSPPGDKSMSLRALMIAALANGKCRIRGLSGGQDVLDTLAALKALGVKHSLEEGVCCVTGVGAKGFKTPLKPLWFGNSATGVRLMMGVLAGQNITAKLDGDESLKGRPMDRVLAPLAKMGARFSPEGVKTLPLTLQGSVQLKPITYSLPIASAQVKSALLLAALNTSGETVVVEDIPTRDHTEHLLTHFGAEIKKQPLANGGVRLTISGRQTLTPKDVSIPGDFSAAAFMIAAALTTPDSHLEIRNVGLNPLRTGFLDVLLQMGANIQVRNKNTVAGEPCGDLVVSHGELSAIETTPAQTPGMIDEFPALFVAAALAKGTSHFRGLSELRMKESDRLRQMALGLAACGVDVKEFDDDLTITGCQGKVSGGAEINAPDDHRIAMAFAILGLATKQPITIKGAKSISTSFPGFAKVMRGVGANFKETLE